MAGLSVVTGNGLDVVRRHPSLIVTTGNTYTVALSIEAVLKAVPSAASITASARLGVVGAAGNIGSTLVRVLADRFTRLKLVGRKASLARVERTAEKIYEDAWHRLAVGGASVGGVAAALRKRRPRCRSSTASRGRPGASGPRVRIGAIDGYGRTRSSPSPTASRISTTVR